MRLWSLHPRYLDAKGLVALWREGLLAKKVLEGKTRGYRNHPQLDRFKKHRTPLMAINAYLLCVWKEAERRGYHFDVGKIELVDIQEKIPVKEKQLEFEFKHLLEKLKLRDMKRYNEIKGTKEIETNPIFKTIPGEIEEWERV